MALTLTARKAHTMGATGCVRQTGSTEGFEGDRRSFYSAKHKVKGYKESRVIARFHLC